MNPLRPVAMAIAALASLIPTAHTLAVDFRFTTGPTVKPTPESGNPTIVVNVGQTKSITLMAKRSGDSGFVNHVDLNILALSTDGGQINGGLGVLNLYRIATGPDGSTYRNYRWDPDSDSVALNSGTGALVVSDFNMLTPAAPDPGLTISDTYTHFADFVIRPTHPGIVQIYLQVGPRGMGETSGVTTSTFGWGDGPFPNNPGELGAVPDLTIIIPEPTALPCLAAATALVPLLTRCRRPA